MRHRRPHQRGVDAAGEQFLDLVLAHHLAQRERHIRQRPPERRDEARQEVIGRGRREAEFEDARAPGRDLPGDVGRGLGEPQDALRLGQETAPGGGQPDGAAGPLQELHVEDALQNLDLPRQGRLRHVQPGGRTPEMQLLRHGGEAPELAEVEHGALPARRGADGDHSASAASASRRPASSKKAEPRAVATTVSSVPLSDGSRVRVRDPAAARAKPTSRGRLERARPGRAGRDAGLPRSLRVTVPARARRSRSCRRRPSSTHT